MGEFELIERYFKRPERYAARVGLGIGDDCALLQPAPDTQLAISCDMLVEGRHFASTMDPFKLGHKALAVNLSDLAACGARQRQCQGKGQRARADDAWLAPFSQGLLALADAHGCELIGGDTTQGPLNICITVFGEVPVVAGRSQALLRSGAQAGDDLYVSGNVGDARLALEVFRGTMSVPEAVFTAARVRLETPTPRVALGLALRGVANAAIDVSDGLLGDLGHILHQSGVGATVKADIATTLIAAHTYYTGARGQFDINIAPEQWRRWALSGGDDYELLFTAPVARRGAVAAAAAASQTPVTRIGQIEAERSLRLMDAHGQPVPNTYASFDHFA
jgi:thiamine-monophosphate kinase